MFVSYIRNQGSVQPFLVFFFHSCATIRGGAKDSIIGQLPNGIPKKGEQAVEILQVRDYTLEVVKHGAYYPG